MRPSKATAHMSTYNRNKQHQKWYCEPIYICTHDEIIGEEIRDECKRREINHNYYPDVIEYRHVEGARYDKLDYNIIKIEMIDTGLKVQQLADWAITEYNVPIPLQPFDYASYMVWIQPKREVNTKTVRTICDSFFSLDDSWEEHWRLDNDDDDDDDLCSDDDDDLCTGSENDDDDNDLCTCSEKST